LAPFLEGVVVELDVVVVVEGDPLGLLEVAL
jgi:hypothetical protein